MIDGDLFVRFALALGVVLGLIAVTGWVGRRYMGAGRIAAFAGKRRRLALLETLQIDSRTRLFLVRRDTAEHLIMVGAAGAVVVERGVTAAPGFAAAVESATAAGENA